MNLVLINLVCAFHVCKYYLKLSILEIHSTEMFIKISLNCLQYLMILHETLDFYTLPFPLFFIDQRTHVVQRNIIQTINGKMAEDST